MPPAGTHASFHTGSALIRPADTKQRRVVQGLPRPPDQGLRARLWRCLPVWPAVLLRPPVPLRKPPQPAATSPRACLDLSPSPQLCQSCSKAPRRRACRWRQRCTHQVRTLTSMLATVAVPQFPRRTASVPEHADHNLGFPVHCGIRGFGGVDSILFVTPNHSSGSAPAPAVLRNQQQSETPACTSAPWIRRACIRALNCRVAEDSADRPRTGSTLLFVRRSFTGVRLRRRCSTSGAASLAD